MLNLLVNAVNIIKLINDATAALSLQKYILIKLLSTSRISHIFLLMRVLTITLSNMTHDIMSFFPIGNSFLFSNQTRYASLCHTCDVNRGRERMFVRNDKLIKYAFLFMLCKLF